MGIKNKERWKIRAISVAAAIHIDLPLGKISDKLEFALREMQSEHKKAD